MLLMFSYKLFKMASEEAGPLSPHPELEHEAEVTMSHPARDRSRGDRVKHEDLVVLPARACAEHAFIPRLS